MKYVPHTSLSNISLLDYPFHIPAVLHCLTLTKRQYQLHGTGRSYARPLSYIDLSITRKLDSLLWTGIYLRLSNAAVNC